MLYAYIDETGDRTSGDNLGNSKIFGLAAVITTEESDKLLKAAIQELKIELNIPANVTLSSKKHLKKPHRMAKAVNKLSSIEDVRIIYVYVIKDLVEGGYRYNPTVFYNYVAVQMYKRILWAARNWKGSHTKIQTAFGHVKYHDNSETKAYFLRTLPKQDHIPTHMEQRLHWVSAQTYINSQAADVYAAILRNVVLSELEPTIENEEHRNNIKKVWHQVRLGPEGCPSNLGIHSMPFNSIFLNSNWNLCVHCLKSE